MSIDMTENIKREEDQMLTLSQIIKHFVRSFKKLWWVSAVCALLLASISFAYFHITFQPRYRSEVKFTITPLVSSNASSGASVYSFNYNSTLATQMAATFPHIINSGIMDDIISNDLRRPFSASLNASAVTDTNIFEVEVTSNSALDSYDVIQSVIKNYPKVAEHVIGDTRMNIIEGSEPVLATKPYNEGYYYKYVVLFGLLGILIGVFVAFVDSRFRKTVTGKADIESYFNGKCICEIPMVRRKRTSKTESILKIGPSLSGFSESIRVLKQRTRNILKNDGAKVVGITSTIQDEGKTTVAYNLARALSGGNSKVLLIDMDLHNRDIQKNINRRKDVPDTGITDVVAGKSALTDVINSVSDTFDVLFAGNENIKFRKYKFADIFEFVRTYYDYIIVDMPTCGIVSETVSIADFCDELLFVVRANAVSPDKVYNALKDMAFSDVKMMGFVVNSVDQNSSGGGYRYYGRYGKRRYGYGYGYGYGYDHCYGGYEQTTNDMSKSNTDK